jgi:hypothetical protein
MNSFPGPRITTVGTEVEYCTRQGPKGLAAYNVREIDETKIRLASPPTSLPTTSTSSSTTAPVAAATAAAPTLSHDEPTKGTPSPPLRRHHGLISWDIDPYKNTPGLITLLTTQPSLPSSISFLSTDLPKLSSSSSSRKGISKGDEVEFDLFYIPGTAYAHARNISLVMTKRNRYIAEQIELFTKAGVVQEHGVIDSIKGDYGFIKSCDRVDQLFFRLDDLVDETIRPNEVKSIPRHSLPPLTSLRPTP